ncbi:MAG: DUF2516 family protein [Actinobacteria bacterium]|nr:DUF2516 family protein [Actinomycetota bacterium]MCB9411633.1 DUF2516 family protein [Actinomycetota bacterium]
MPDIVDLVVTALRIGLTIATLVALVDAVRRPAQAFTYVGRLSKPMWIGILAIAAAFVFIAPVSILGLAGVVAMGVYFADIRPKIKEVTGG